MQEGLDPATKNRAPGMGNPTCPRSCCLPMVHRVRTLPLRNLSPGQVGSRWLVAVVSMRKQDRWRLYRTSGQLQRLGTRTLGVTSGRTRILRIFRLIAGVFALGLTPSTRAHQRPLVSAWKSSQQCQSALSQHGSVNRKSDLGSGHSLLQGQKQSAITHSFDTQNTISMSPRVLQCSLSAVVDNRPSAATRFWRSLRHACLGKSRVHAKSRSTRERPTQTR